MEKQASMHSRTRPQRERSSDMTKKTGTQSCFNFTNQRIKPGSLIHRLDTDVVDRSGPWSLPMHGDEVDNRGICSSIVPLNH